VRDRIRGNTFCSKSARAFLACEVGVVVRGHEDKSALAHERTRTRHMENTHVGPKLFSD
jgi:hypothetical protein